MEKIQHNREHVNYVENVLSYIPLKYMFQLIIILYRMSEKYCPIYIVFPISASLIQYFLYVQ